MSARAHLIDDLPFRSTQSYSVTTMCVLVLEVVTEPLNVGTILEVLPSRPAVEWLTIKDWRNCANVLSRKNFTKLIRFSAGVKPD